MYWTSSEHADLEGKVIIVTGGNSGLGFESVKALSARGAEVIMASRDEERGGQARKMILLSMPGARIRVMQLDLSDLGSVRNFAEEFRSNYTRLDVLLNNAGIMMTPYFTTRDGFEGQFGTNHLGHFALTGLLMDTLLQTPAARIVNVSSIAHRRGDMDFSKLQYEGGKDYSPSRAYGRSKLANLLFTYELQRKLEAAGKEQIALAAHPGIAQTNLARHLEGRFMFKLMMPLFKMMTQDQADGALPQLRAAIDPGVKGGEYYGPDGKREWRGSPIRVSSSEASHSPEDAAQLWVESEKLTGITFPI